MKFDEIINSKYQSLISEAQPVLPVQTAQQNQVAQIPQPQQAQQQGQQAPTNQQQPQQDPQKQQAQAGQGVESDLATAFQKVPFNNPDTAVKMLNTSLANFKTNQQFKNFWSNVGYDNQKGEFAIVPQPVKGQPGSATAPQQQRQG